MKIQNNTALDENKTINQYLHNRTLKLIQTAQQLGEHKAQLSIGIFLNVECSVARWGIPQLLAKYEKALQIHFLDGVAQLQ